MSVCVIGFCLTSSLFPRSSWLMLVFMQEITGNTAASFLPFQASNQKCCEASVPEVERHSHSLLNVRFTQTAQYLRAVELFEVRAQLLTDTQVDGHKADNGCLSDAALRILETLQHQTIIVNITVLTANNHLAKGPTKTCREIFRYH